MPSSKASVLDVGNCSPDHGMIRQLLTEHFEVQIDRVMFVDDALARMREQPYALVLFNRLIFDGGSEGIKLLHQAKADAHLAKTPVMMISNFAKAQETAVAAGAERGFGKSALSDLQTVELLARYLPKKEPGARA